jgi:hypothetical protein
MMGLGAKGAAFSKAISQLYAAVIYYLVAFRTIRYIPPMRYCIYPISISALIAFAFYILKVPETLAGYPVATQALSLIGHTFVFAGTYLVLSVLMDKSVGEQIRYVWEAFNPKTMYNYIKSELTK